MKYYLTFFLGILLTALRSNGQGNDSTDKFKCAFETVTITNEWFSEDTLRLTDFSDRFSLYLTDVELRHCFITAKLIEYKDGKKIRDTFPLFKEAIYKDQRFASFEDSSFIFSLYKKVKNNSQFIWGFRTPSAMSIETAEMKSEDYYIGTVDPQREKLPIGKPFTFLVITLPDKTRNFPFLMEKNKGKFHPHKWNKIFGLGHTFLIELTIERSNEKTENKNLLKI